MAINSTSARINHFCRYYINPKIQARVDKAIADGWLTGDYPSALLDVLLHEKADSSIITWLKLSLFYFELNGLGNITEPGVEIAKIYGMPLDSIQESVRWIPQIKIFFREKPIEAWQSNRRPRQAEMTIRVNKAIKQLIEAGKASLYPLSQLIADTFKDITYGKGFNKYHYRDLDNNYRLSVFTQNEIEAKALITALLSINADTPDFTQYLIYPQTTKDYNAVETKQILGETIALPQERTEANMIFYRAELHWKGIEPILLVNNSNRNRGAIIELQFL